MTYEDSKPPAANSICQELEKYIEELHTEYEIWHAKSVRKTYRWWWLLQAISLGSGFAFAVTAALAAADMFTGTRYKTFSIVALIVLPALSSLAANTLIQFRVYDIWRLREKGRISFQDLVVEGRRRIRTATSAQDCAQIFEELEKKAHEIESGQSEGFFSFTKSDFISRFNREDAQK